jgi:hypothetical protein
VSSIVAVHTANIVVSYKVNKVKRHTSREDICVRRSVDTIYLFLAEGVTPGENSGLSKIAHELSKVLEISPSECFSTLISHTDALGALMDLQGIPELEDSDPIDDESLHLDPAIDSRPRPQATPTNVPASMLSPPVTQSRFVQSRNNPSAVTSATSLVPREAMGGSIPRGGGPRTHVSGDSGRPVFQSAMAQAQRYSAGGAVQLTSMIPPALSGNGSVSPFPILAASSSSIPDPRGLEIGLRGELFVCFRPACPTQLTNASLQVFEYLCWLLPGFTHANWTSEARESAGHPKFEGISHADFWYHDLQGVFTRELFPDKPHFHGATPEYFIEVKSTSGPQGDRLFMHGSQFLKARSDFALSERC